MCFRWNSIQFYRWFFDSSQWQLNQGSTDCIQNILLSYVRGTQPGMTYPKAVPRVKPDVPIPTAFDISFGLNQRFAKRPAYGSTIARENWPINWPTNNNGNKWRSDAAFLNAEPRNNNDALISITLFYLICNFLFRLNGNSHFCMLRNVCSVFLKMPNKQVSVILYHTSKV